MRAFTLYNGSHSQSNPYGLQPAWRDGGVAWLVSELASSYALGFRRFMLSLPAGRLQGADQPWPQSQWFALDDAGISCERDSVRADFNAELCAFVATHQDAHVDVYLGGVISASLADRDTAGAHAPVVADANDRAILERNLWATGYDRRLKTRFGYWFDNSSTDAKLSREIAVCDWLWLTHGMLGGLEAIPNTGAGSANVPDLNVLSRYRALCVRAFLQPTIAGGGAALQSARSAWRLDSQSTECRAMLAEYNNGPFALSDADGEALLRDWHGRGFVIGCYGDRWQRAIMEITS